MEYINLDFVKPDKDCVSCDHYDDYTCFECESIQVREKYPNAIYDADTIPPEWYIKKIEGR
jgi:hypothetical protein